MSYLKLRFSLPHPLACQLQTGYSLPMRCVARTARGDESDDHGPRVLIVHRSPAQRAIDAALSQ